MAYAFDHERYCAELAHQAGLFEAPWAPQAPTDWPRPSPPAPSGPCAN
ncbi:hypothetical protein ACWV95_18155 [Streptomyces albus]